MTFEKTSALTLLDLCSEAYAFANTGHCALPAGFSDPQAIRLPKEGRPLLLKNDSLDIFGFTTAKDGVLYIVYRGTQILSGIDFAAEWALDALSLPLARLGPGYVHFGFYEAWQGLRQATMDCMGNYPATMGRIITGHSLGAAIATLCWADLGGELLTFASPRVGNPAFADHLWNERTVRVVNEPDAVPCVPVDTGGLFSPFRHGGTEIDVKGTWNAFNVKIAHQLESYRMGIEALP